MIKKAVIILFILLLVSTNAAAQPLKDIEIFDVNKGCVINTLQSNSAIQKEVRKYLKGITGMYPKVNAIPDNGYIIKIPLDPHVRVQNQWLNQLVDQVFIVFPQQENPYLLVLDSLDRPLFYVFEGSVDKLLEDLNFQRNILNPDKQQKALRNSLYATILQGFI